MPAYSLVVHMRAKSDSIEKLTTKLQEASQVYSNDKECLSWRVYVLYGDLIGSNFCVGSSCKTTRILKISLL